MVEEILKIKCSNQHIEYFARAYITAVSISDNKDTLTFTSVVTRHSDIAVGIKSMPDKFMVGNSIYEYVQGPSVTRKVFKKVS